MSPIDPITYQRSCSRYRGRRHRSAVVGALRAAVVVGIVACGGGDEEALPENAGHQRGDSPRAQHSDSSAVHLEAAASHYRLGQHDEAIAAFRRALDLAPQKPGVRYALAMSLRARHRHAEAVEELQQAVALAPHRAEYQYRYGEALLAVDDVAGALEAFEEAIRLDSTHVNAHLDRARLLAQINRLSEAEADFERVIALQPQNVWAHLGLGGIYTQQERLREAVDALQDATALEPRNAHAHYLLSQAYLRSGQHREREEALGVFRRLSGAEEHLKQGAIYAERGALDRAIASWERALQVDSTCVDAYLRLGQAYVQAERPEEAKDALLHVLELDPEHAGAREQLAQMEKQL